MRFSISPQILSIPSWWSFFIAVVLATTDSDVFIRQPINQSVTLNSTFTLECRFKIGLFQNLKDSSKPQIHWSKNGFGLGTSREDIQAAGMGSRYKYSRYDLPLNLDEGQYDLQITNAEITDEGKYICQLAHNGMTTLSQTAIISVYVPSADPILVQLHPDKPGELTPLKEGEQATIVEGEILRLRCIAADGKPGANLVWLLNGIPIKVDFANSTDFGSVNNGIEGNVSYATVQAQQYPYLVTAMSDLTVYITKLNHGQLIQCNAENIGYELFKQKPALTSLNVLYPPFVRVRTSTQTVGALVENDVVTLHCSAEGRPDNFRWSWSVNDTLIPDVKAPQYRLRLTRDLFNVPVRCIATTFKSESVEIKLQFNYAPKFHQAQDVLYGGSPNENARLQCTADGNPKPVIEWRRGRSGPVLTRGEVLLRQKIQPDDFGTYLCTAYSEGFAPITKEVILARKSPPSIKLMEPVLVAIGSSVRIPCTVYSVPLPSRKELLWSRRGVALRETSHRQFVSEEFIGGLVHVMVFKHVMSTDFGFYNCSASNGYGSAWQTFELRRDSDLSVSLLAGISSTLVIFIVISLAVVFLCHRRQSRIKNAKNEIFADAFNKHTGTEENSYGYLGRPVLRNKHKTSLTESKQNDSYLHRSASESTEADSFTRYQYPSNVRTAPLRHPITTMASDRYLRSVSPICSYALMGDRQIPVCTNMAVAFTNADGTQLPGEICIPSLAIPESYAVPNSEYQHLSFFNAPSLSTAEPFQFSSNSDSDVPANIQHLGFVPLTNLPADSDIVLNTQVTSV